MHAHGGVRENGAALQDVEDGSSTGRRSGRRWMRVSSLPYPVQWARIRKVWAAENGRCDPRCDPMAACKPKVEYEVALAVLTPPTKPSNASPSRPHISPVESSSAQRRCQSQGSRTSTLPSSSDTCLPPSQGPCLVGCHEEHHLLFASCLSLPDEGAVASLVLNFRWTTA